MPAMSIAIAGRNRNNFKHNLLKREKELKITNKKYYMNMNIFQKIRYFRSH
jgi:hypothetical protein